MVWSGGPRTSGVNHRDRSAGGTSTLTASSNHVCPSTFLVQTRITSVLLLESRLFLYIRITSVLLFPGPEAIAGFDQVQVDHVLLELIIATALREEPDSVYTLNPRNLTRYS